MGAEEDKDFYLDIETLKIHEFCAKIVQLNFNIKCFRNITGAFPHHPIRGGLYVMVLYDYDINAILDEPLKIGRQKTSAMLSSRSTTY